MIEESIGHTLEPDSARELERHLAECTSCVAYREALLADDSLLDEYVSRHADSVRSVEEKAAGARPTGIAAAPRRFAVAHRLARIPKPLQIAAGVAVALAIVGGIDLFRGYGDGSIPAYASVVAKMEKSENVSYRERTWNNGRWRTRDRIVNSAGVSRSDYGDSVIVTTRGFSALKLYPREKRAVLYEMISDRQLRSFDTDESSVERLATWHKKRNFTYLRRKWYDGKWAAMYQGIMIVRGKPSDVKFVTLVDLDTQLPMRVEITNTLKRNTADSGPLGMRLRDFIPPASPRPKDFGWVDIREDEPRIIEDNFRWNMPIDTSLFSLTPPEGYTVRIIQDSIVHDWIAARERKRVPWEAKVIRDGLREWLSLSGNTFPSSLRDLGDAEKARPLLIAKYNRAGIPGDEYRAAISAASQLTQSTRSAESLKRYGQITYVGRGCTFGDPARIVCWMQDTNVSFFVPELKGKEPYAVIYADLHIEMSDTPPTLPKE